MQTTPISRGQRTEIFRATSFRAWTGDRHVASLGTNAGASPIAFQRWRNFKEAFAPEIVERAVRETTGEVRHIIDPFGGSGTTAIAAQFLGAKPTVIEVNPYLADLIEAKLAVYDVDRVADSFVKVCQDASNANTHQNSKLRAVPGTFIEPGLNGKYIFSKVVADRILSYAGVIDRLPALQIRRLFRVLLGSVAVSSSNILISGKGRRYRKCWRSRSISADQVDKLFQESVLDAIYDLRLYESRACREYKVLRGDSRKLVTQAEPADLSVFSPPYPNSFDYTDVYNVELWMMGYLHSAAENRRLRKRTLRSHVQIKRDMNGTRYSSFRLVRTLRALDAVRSKLWNRHIPEMISAYFSDMGDVISSLGTRLRPKGRIYMVVGDSRYAGVKVPVADILTQIAPSTGFKVLVSEACRSMRVSPQQGGRRELAEKLLVLERL
jgi:hypothetical protein